MGIKVTHGDFIKKVSEKFGDEYIILGKYEKMREKILVKHNICENEYYVSPDNLLRGKKCPKCSNEKKRRQKSSDIDKFRKTVEELVGNEYSVVGDNYVNAKTKIEMKHNKCGYSWDVQPYHFIKNNGTRCPLCSQKRIGKSKRKSQEDFSKEVDMITNGEYTVISNYINAVTKIDILHNKCRNIYHVEPNSFLNGNRCNKCKSSVSKGEKAIYDYLESKSVDFAFQISFDDCRNIHRLPFDFAIFDKNKNIVTIIEYDGRQHFEAIDFWGGEEEFERIVKCDNIKNEYCKNNDIKLVRIPYWDFNNIEKILDDLF